MKLTVRTTADGPIVSGVLDDARAAGRGALVDGKRDPITYSVAMAWTALTPGRTADALFALDQASNWTEFRSAASLFDVPSQNMTYADVDGNIGYQAPGRIPIRASSTPGAPPGAWPSEGWLSKYDWKGYVPFDRMPSSYNPPEGFIVTANQAGRRPDRAVPHDGLGLRLPRAADPHPAAGRRQDQPGRHELDPAGRPGAVRLDAGAVPAEDQPAPGRVHPAGAEPAEEAGTSAPRRTPRRRPTTTRCGATSCG